MTDTMYRVWTDDDTYRDITHDQFVEFDSKTLHRTGGPAIKSVWGYKGWYTGGICHRIGGPAIVLLNRTKEWYQNGHIHRIDGPASISEIRPPQWFIRGQCINRAVEEEILEGRLNEWPNWTRNDYIYFKLKFC